jgi:hypothetical protein
MGKGNMGNGCSSTARLEREIQVMHFMHILPPLYNRHSLVGGRGNEENYSSIGPCERTHTQLTINDIFCNLWLLQCLLISIYWEMPQDLRAQMNASKQETTQLEWEVQRLQAEIQQLQTQQKSSYFEQTNSLEQELLQVRAQVNKFEQKQNAPKLEQEIQQLRTQQQEQHANMQREIKRLQAQLSAALEQLREQGRYVQSCFVTWLQPR